MILAGTSKSCKSWCLLDLALSAASGKDWWGRRCSRVPVLYINFELHPWAIAQRLNSLAASRPECTGVGDTFHLWNLRGHSSDLSLLRPQLERQLQQHNFGLIILDPAYKLLGDRDENSNGEVAALMNEFDKLAQSTDAALVIAHHFAKGDSASKSAIDRMSGAGAWARDPDSILILTPHEEPDCFTVTSILRNLPILPEFVLSWQFPLMRIATDLNPDALRRTQGRSKICTDKQFLDQAIGSSGRSFTTIINEAEKELAMSRATAARYLARLAEAGLVTSSSGLYWRTSSGEVSPSHTP
jgi:hypothetical protein